MTRKNILIVFSRYPEPGITKTRLIPVLGPERAAILQRQMTEDTIAKVRELITDFPLEIEICYEGGSEPQMVEWLGEFDYQQQIKGDLGGKMSEAFARHFQQKNKKIVIIGTDCPGLNGEMIREAFDLLSNNDLVLGPACDGGYYLIGQSTEAPFLFIDIPWGTGDVLLETNKMALFHQLKVSYLKELADIDRPEDLSLLAGVYAL